MKRLSAGVSPRPGRQDGADGPCGWHASHGQGWEGLAGQLASQLQVLAQRLSQGQQECPGVFSQERFPLVWKANPAKRCSRCLMNPGGLKGGRGDPADRGAARPAADGTACGAAFFRCLNRNVRKIIAF